MLRVHSIESFGTNDGPGIRLVIFVQGCLFKCLYCQNPDTLSRKGGTLMASAELMKLAEKQRPYFGKTGGITISGGEPTLQAKVLIPFFTLLKKAGIHMALDTNGSLVNDDVKKLHALTDLVILDVKHIDPAGHLALTGMSNANPLAIAVLREKTGKPMWLRYVMVPGHNDDEAIIRRWCETFKDYKTVERVELLPYHTLGEYKYKELGWKYPLEGMNPPNVEAIANAKRIFAEYFSNVSVH